MRRLPLVPTLMTLIMAGVMVWLGVWQLHRRDEKHRLIAALEAAKTLPPVSPSEFYRAMIGAGSVQYRRAVVPCRPGRVAPYDIRGGESPSGQGGFLVLVACSHPPGRGPDLVVVAGWSNKVAPPKGLVIDTEFDGTIIERPYGKEAGRPPFMLIPRTAVPPLQVSRMPRPEDLPDNHLSYAIQWFAFAATLLVIYTLFILRGGRKVTKASPTAVS